VEAHAAAHADPATKRLARLVLGVAKFTRNMGWAKVWDAPYKAGLREKLHALGAPLAEAFVREGQRAVLGALTLPEHALVAAARRRFAEVGVAFELRSDLPGIVPVPSAWSFDEPVARERHEREFTHLLKMLGMVLNEQFHAMMREVLEPFAVPGLGLFERGVDGACYICPEKGVARMECKRVTDHAGAAGCRPGLNIDVVRVLVVCETPDQMTKALAALGARFGGCGRVKNGFGADDAKAAAGFHLRVMMANLVVPFGCTYGELLQRPGVRTALTRYVESSVPAGGAPRGRWRAAAAVAMAALASDEFAAQPVHFICEAQLVLRQTYEVRSCMHELYKGYRADSCDLLHADMVAETAKVEAAALFMADGALPLRQACRDGEVGAAVALLGGGGGGGRGVAVAERVAAFVVACARGRGAVLVAVGSRLLEGANAAAVERAWGEGWRRSAGEGAEDAVGEAVVAALLGLLALAGARARIDGGVCGGVGLTALGRAAEGGHALAVAQLLTAGAVVDAKGGCGETPLWWAARSGQAEVVRRLLGAGAAVNAVGGGGGSTPLYMAAEQGHADVAEVLLGSGAAVDAAREGGATPLSIAAHWGHEAVVAVLLGNGAVVDQADEVGATPLFVAAEKGFEAIVGQLLAAGAAVDQAKDTGATPLIMAAQKGFEAIVGQLLAAGAAVDQAKDTGATPLFMAAQKGFGAIVGQLLAAGAAVDQANSNQSSPLGMASADGHTAVVELLLAAGADVTHEDKWGDSPLSEAVSNGHERAAELLRAAAACP
jgi:ankyrin repeat protein